MKIAAVTEDGVTISQHFGRAPYYVVLTVEDGQVVGREQREKVAHGWGAGGHVHVEGQAHGFDAASQDTHGRMAAPIADCQVLLARGMGMGAYESLRQAGIRPVITTIANIEEAALQAANGTIIDHQERLH
jgi:predicted Fe-Mo cluster-binding NifX family protein